MKLRQAVKILKNHYRELIWVRHDNIVEPKSRYKPHRVWDAHCQVIKAYKNRKINEAKRNKTDIPNFNVVIGKAYAWKHIDM